MYLLSDARIPRLKRIERFFVCFQHFV